ncbi:MAG: peptide chain release factor N(5)-glutamine methyltransferase [Pseudomonadota bacterium]
MKVREAIAGAGIDPREARILLAEASGFSQASLIASDDRDLPDSILETFESLASRRKRGEPVAYILGRKEFYGLELAVNPAVLIPRPETELLVDLAIERRPASVLDLGTGSGAIALALKRNLPGTKVAATEADLSALVTAQRNAARLGLDIDFRHGRWFEPVAGERFELLVSNPPYVAEGDPHLAELRFEPRGALLAGADGLDCIRGIVRGAPEHLLHGGWLLLEHGLGQDRAVRDLLAEQGFASITTWPDLAGIPRVSGGKCGGKR